MGFFSFGRQKASNSSQQSAETFIDPTQQRYLEHIRREAQRLNAQPMPVEGVAGINLTLANALRNANQAGQMQTSAGAGLIGAGSGQLAGTGMALNYANRALGGTGNIGIDTAIGTGRDISGMTHQIFGAKDSGVDLPTANALAGSATPMQAANNTGINLDDAQQIGNLALQANPAAVADPDFAIPQQTGNLAAQAGIAQNQGFSPANLDSYINNNLVSGQIDAASRDVMRNLREMNYSAIPPPLLIAAIEGRHLNNASTLVQYNAPLTE